MNTVKLHGSSSAFAKGKLVFTRYNTGCVRNILFKSHGIRETFKSDTQAVGVLNEDLYGKRLDGQAYIREHVVTNPSDRHDGAVFSGRVDYFVPGEVIELKSSQSKNKLAELKKGIYTLENLAQTVAYMLETDSHQGRLIYTYYGTRKDTGAFESLYERSFDITFDETGNICVSNKPTGFKVSDLYNHQDLVYHHVSTNSVCDRPYGYQNAYGSPCTYCPFAEACDAWDDDRLNTTEELLKEAKRCVT